MGYRISFKLYLEQLNNLLISKKFYSIKLAGRNELQLDREAAGQRHQGRGDHHLYLRQQWVAHKQNHRR